MLRGAQVVHTTIKGSYCRFRIDYADVTVVPDVTKKADAKTKSEFNDLIQGAGIETTELQLDKEKTNRQGGLVYFELL